jgi:hypothetical protein
MSAQCTYFKYYFEPIGKDNKGKDKFHTYRKKDVIEWNKSFNADKLRPVFIWQAQEVINYIIENGQQPNSLYYQGFKRVGCFPCIMSAHRETRLIIENHPEQWENLKRVEKEIGSTFFPPNYIPKRFQANGKFCTALDVEKYLKDKNNTLNMFEESTPSCMSAYNLCE